MQPWTLSVANAIKNPTSNPAYLLPMRRYDAFIWSPQTSLAPLAFFGVDKFSGT